jgi:hypothetical protein
MKQQLEQALTLRSAASLMGTLDLHPLPQQPYTPVDLAPSSNQGVPRPDEVTNKDGRQHSEKKSPPGCPARPPSHRVHPCRHLGWGLRLSGVPRYANTTTTQRKRGSKTVNSRDCSMLPLAGNVLRKRASEARRTKKLMKLQNDEVVRAGRCQDIGEGVDVS